MMKSVPSEGLWVRGLDVGGIGNVSSGGLGGRPQLGGGEGAARVGGDGNCFST